MNLPAYLRAIAAILLLSTAGLTAAEPPAAVPPTEITSRKLEMWSTDTETRSVFDGGVTVTGNNIKITCDHLEVVASRSADKLASIAKPDQFKSLVATGNVRIVQGDREVTCGRAEIFPGEDKLVLTEEPTVFDHSGPSIGTGTKITLLRGQRRLYGDDIKFSFPPIKDLGFTKDQPIQPPAPVPAPEPQK